MKCKSCQIDFNNPPPTVKRKFRFPTNIPVSKEMQDTVTKLRRQQDAKASKSWRQKR